MSLLGAIYGTAVGTRNRLYDRKVFRAKTLPGPVVSVGNVSAGGAGKTPFVILLGELLKQRNIPFNVLSRGYGRSTRGVLLVDPNGSAADFGDEPVLIARHLSCPVIVGESRYEAGRMAEMRFGPQVHLLDDGFQHRALARDFDIALVTPEDLGDRLLPTGRLREPLSSLDRADALVLMDNIDISALPAAGKAIWRVKRSMEIANPPARPVVFCGVARPQRFLDQLNRNGFRPVAQRIYRDHHTYSDSDIDDLVRLKAQNNADGFITTEKDVVNLGARVERLQPLAMAKVAMEIAAPTDALDSMLQAIADRKQKT